MNKAIALRQHFTPYELSRMPDIVRNSPEALEYYIWLMTQTEADDEE